MTDRPSSPVMKTARTASSARSASSSSSRTSSRASTRACCSHVEVDLPDEPLQYTAVPNADLKEGIWGEAGVNEANVAMSATETLTTNERVLGADPFVELTPAKGKEGEDGYEPEVARRHWRRGLPHPRAAVRQDRP